MRDTDQPSAIAALFSPRSVAIVGASTDPRKLGGKTLKNLCDFGFAGAIYPVHPREAEVQGLPAVSDIRDIAGPVDLAVIVVPPQAVAEQLRHCGEKGVRAVQILTAGFAESGPEGRILQDELMEIARRYGLRVTGPNALGSASPGDRLAATFSGGFIGMEIPAGPVAMVTQSGAFGSAAYVMAARRNLGLSRILATGNEADIHVAEVIEWLAGDPQTRVICAALESCRDGAHLRRALLAAARAGKPVIFMKLGRSEIGARAAQTHTGALAGDDKVYDAVLRECGAWRAATIEEMIDTAYVLAVGGQPRGDRTSLITVSGGVGILMADACDGTALTLPPQSPTLRARVHDSLSIAEGSNPLDVTAQAQVYPRAMPDIYEAVLASGEYDAEVIFFSNKGMSRAIFDPILADLAPIRARHGDRIMVAVTPALPAIQAGLDAAGIPAFEDPSRAVRALANARGLVRRRDVALAEAGVDAGPAQPQDRIDPTRPMDEAEAKRVLARAGLPVLPEETCRTAEAAAEAAERMGFPVALKVLSVDIAHKTEVGGIALDLRDAAAVRAGFETILANAARARPDAVLDGVLVAPMARDGAEILLGLHRDPVFGLMLAVGAGGVMAELLADVSLASLPVSRTRAEALIDGTAWSRLLEPWRGRGALDRAALVDAICRLSEFGVANADGLTSVEMNPLLVREEGAVALDALIQTAPPA